MVPLHTQTNSGITVSAIQIHNTVTAFGATTGTKGKERRKSKLMDKQREDNFLKQNREHFILEEKCILSCVLDQTNIINIAVSNGYHPNMAIQITDNP